MKTVVALVTALIFNVSSFPLIDLSDNPTNSEILPVEFMDRTYQVRIKQGIRSLAPAIR
jgi:hypothetical protein